MLITLTGPGPLYQQIYQSLRQKILAGELQEGTRMPSSRILADNLCVSRNIVLIAYDQLIAEGYLESRQGSGTYVSTIPDNFLKSETILKSPNHRPSIPPRLSNYAQRLEFDFPNFLCRSAPGKRKAKYDFRYGHPATDLLDQRVWRRLIMRRAITFTRDEMGYSVPEGVPALRATMADYLRLHRGVECSPEQVVIVNGSQQAIDLINRILVNPGDAVVVEDPCYLGTRLSLAAVGANIQTIGVDDKGLLTDELQAISQQVRLICVTPSHQYPTGSVMSLNRRLDLLAFARSVGAYILEDDYDSEFRFDSRPEKSVQGLDPDGRVIYVGTFSKVLFPALRLGYVVLPKTLLETFVRAKSLTDRHTAVYAQGVLDEFIRQGHFERHLRRVRLRVSERRDALIKSLKSTFGNNIRISGQKAGVHVLVWIPKVSRLHVADGIERANELDVGVYPVDPCYTKPPKTPGLVMGYASMDPADIHEGVTRLGKALRL